MSLLANVLFAANHATPLPEADFWENDLDCEQLAIRHYVGNVRHRRYAHAYPCVAAQALASNGK